MHRKRVLPFVAAVVAAGTAFAVSGPASAGALAAPAGSTSAAAKAAAAKVAPGIALARERGVVLTRHGKLGPYGPNPMRAMVPNDRKVDWGGWRHAEAQLSKKRAAKARALVKAKGLAVAPRYVREDEPAGTRGSNDSFRTAQRIPSFGTAKGRYPAITVLGRLSAGPVAPVEDVAPAPEPNDSLETAYDLGVSRTRGGAHTTGAIGDYVPDPKDPNVTDIDTYKVTLKANQQMDVSVKRTSGDLLPFMVLLDAKGNLITFSEDDFEGNASLRYTARATSTYYVLTGGYIVFDLDAGTTTITKGGYDLTVTTRPGDRDLYAVSLRAGDVLGANVTDAAAYVSVFDAKGVEVHGSPGDASFIYPENSPLPGGGNAATDHVVARSGTYYVEVTQGNGAYQAQLEVYRYGGEAKKQTQTIYLDTNGQRLNTGIFGGRGVTTLSPLRAFLGRWGLARSQEVALIKKIKATVQENLDADLRRSGLSRYVSVKVVTSLDGKDPYGRAGVSRVVVGGTIEESGVYTIGIAQSIDPGNYDREETALVLLDVLSSSPDEFGEASLNSWMTRRSNRLSFVGQAVGNVISHEVGHFIGNWHTDNSNSTANLMDAGGENFNLLFGVGKDRVGGTRDDVDVDFRKDRFEPDEGFTGIEDTLARSVFGMSTRR
jgi:hypothetical protein